MSHPSDTPPSEVSEGLLPRLATPPKQPGFYWFMPDGGTREVMVEVSLVDGELSAYWLNRHIPLPNLHGTWRGPVQPFGAANTK